MVKEDIIKFIIKTYDLSPKLENEINSIAIRRIEELSVEGFDETYRYIGQLIDKFEVPYKERVALRLDKPIYPGSKTTFHDLIEVEDPNLTRGSKFSEEVSLDEILSTLKGHIDNNDLDLIKQLAPQNKSFRDILLDPKNIIENAPQIHSKLEELVHTYERNGKIIIPKRPIIEVKFHPLYIKFGSRKYNGNPLAFFNEHIEDYKGMSRTELVEFDSGLYVSLVKYKQIDKAIPKKKNTGLSKEEIDELVETLLKNKGNFAKTGKQLKYVQSTIRKYARMKGIEPLGKKVRYNSLNLEQQKEVISAYWNYSGNAAEATRNLPYCNFTFRKYWRKENLKIAKQGGNRYK